MSPYCGGSRLIGSSRYVTAIGNRSSCPRAHRARWMPSFSSASPCTMSRGLSRSTFRCGVRQDLWEQTTAHRDGTGDLPGRREECRERHDSALTEPGEEDARWVRPVRHDGLVDELRKELPPRLCLLGDDYWSLRGEGHAKPLSGSSLPCTDPTVADRRNDVHLRVRSYTPLSLARTSDSSSACFSCDSPDIRSCASRGSSSGP